MDFDLSTLLPIILAVLYYAFTGANRKKKKEQGPLAQDSSPGPESLGPPPLSQRPTFEELLEEFTGQKKVEEVPELLPEPVVPVPTYANVTRSSEHRPGIKDKKQYKALINFEEYKEETDVDQEDYRELFSDQDAAKRAFISSEIFNRKY